MVRTKSQLTSESEFVTAVQMLTDELKVLRMVVDELREEVQWANQNYRDDSRVLIGRRIRSCSLDPTCPDFTVNTVDDATVEELRAELTPPDRGVSGKQGELFN